jgi:outer membrane protein TolC
VNFSRRSRRRRPQVFAFAALPLAAATVANAAAPATPETPPPAATTPAAPPAGNSSAGATPATTAAAVSGAAGVGTTPASALPTPLTLRDAINFALQLQPDIYVSIADRESAEQRLRQANARFLPTLTPQYTYIYNYTFVDANRFVTAPDTTTGGGTTTDTGAASRQVVALPQSTTRTVRQGDLSFRYLLYDGGQREASRQQAQASLRAARFGEADTRQLVIGAVADAYFGALRNEALVRVSESQVARAQNTLDVIRAQVEAEVAARKDILQAEADFLNAQVNLLQARNNADVAQAQLKNTIGIVGGGRLTLADVPPPAPDTPATATLSAAPATTDPAGATGMGAAAPGSVGNGTAGMGSAPGAGLTAANAAAAATGATPNAATPSGGTPALRAGPADSGGQLAAPTRPSTTLSALPIKRAPTSPAPAKPSA